MSISPDARNPKMTLAIQSPVAVGPAEIFLILTMSAFTYVSYDHIYLENSQKQARR